LAQRKAHKLIIDDETKIESLILLKNYLFTRKAIKPTSFQIYKLSNNYTFYYLDLKNRK